MDEDAESGERVARLEEEVISLRGAIWLVHRIADLVRATPEMEPTCYAVLLGVTSGVGLGFDRAMLFLTDPARRTRLLGAGAFGAERAEEAPALQARLDADVPRIEALYEAALRLHAGHQPLDARVRGAELDAGGATPVALALRRGLPVIGEGEADPAGLLDPRTCISAPARGRGSIVGVLYADNRWRERKIDPVSQLVFTMVADHAGRAIESAQEFERLAREAHTDALTGLPHHGVLMTDLAREAESALTSGQPLGFVMIDLDDFKRINDRLGHPAGDALLSGVAARLQGVVRGREGVYRYGGEEFAVLLRATPVEHVRGTAERLRRLVEALAVDVGDGPPLHVTVSVGVATYPELAVTTPSQLVEAADQALYRAKHAGRNRVSD